MYARIYTPRHVCTYTPRHVCTYTPRHVCTYIHAQACVLRHTQACMYTCGWCECVNVILGAFEGHNQSDSLDPWPIRPACPPDLSLLPAGPPGWSPAPVPLASPPSLSPAPQSPRPVPPAGHLLPARETVWPFPCCAESACLENGGYGYFDSFQVPQLSKIYNQNNIIVHGVIMEVVRQVNSFK